MREPLTIRLPASHPRRCLRCRTRYRSLRLLRSRPLRGQAVRHPPQPRRTFRLLTPRGTICRGANMHRAPTSIPTFFFQSGLPAALSNKPTLPSRFAATVRWPTSAWNSLCGPCRIMAFGAGVARMSAEQSVVHVEPQHVEPQPLVLLRSQRRRKPKTCRLLGLRRR